jgi:peptidoglycan/LPS O-acetylase OafA/YrhL
MLRRSVRLDPPYWASILIAVSYGMAAATLITDKSHGMPSGPQILAHIFYLQEFLHFDHIIYVYWTLCVEIQFYLVFCLLLAIVHWLRQNEFDNRSLFALFLPCSLMSLLWPSGLLTNHVPGLFIPFWYAFLLGVLTCWAVNRTIKPVWFHSFALLVLAVAVMNGDGFAIAAVVTSEVIAETGRRDKLSAWLDWRWLQVLGLISYSLYLIHSFVGPGVFFIGYRITDKTPLTEALWLVVGIVACVAAAYVFWWLIERPSHALSRRIRLEIDRSPAGVDRRREEIDEVTPASSLAVSPLRAATEGS